MPRPTARVSRPSPTSGADPGEIEQAGFTIIANMGDQPSTLGGRTERMFLLPNPFYRVP
jgi:hypothetical protein